MDDFNRFGIGGNLPPNDAAILRETLAEKNTELLDRQKDLIAAADRAPASCNDEDSAKKFTDTIKMMTACKKSLESRRIDEKAPYLALERTVDGFFKPLTDELDKAKAKLEKILSGWLQQKAAEERRLREEEAERARQEAQRKADEAAALAQAQMPHAAEKAFEEAQIAEQQATKADEASQQRAAKLASTHGDYGSRASLRSFKVASIVSRQTLDIEALRPYFSEGHLQIALNAYMAANWKDDANPPNLAGAAFSIETKALVR